MADAKLNPAELQKSLKGMDYPATQEQLVKHARSNNADRQVIEFLERIPSQEYTTPAQVTKQMGNEADSADEPE